MSWNDMNTARKLYIKASADLCNAVMIYQNCSNSKCGGSGTIKPDDEGDQAKLEFELVTSNDPNDKVGGHGIGDNRWLTDNEPLRSVIYFENKSTATADAQDVVITDQLDSNKVDLSTLQFGIATFDDKIITSQTSVNALAGSNEFNAQVDLRPARNLAVNINAAVNPNTGLLTWRFNTIDPATRKPPEIDGFLPPGKEGSISFTVMPKKDLPTGTVVRNKATIKFDFNDPIDTPEWFNTIDNTKPTSHVLTLNATQTTPNFAVKWAGQDDGAGVQDYTVYVAENGGAFAAWLANTTATEAVYAGQVGKSYSFYSIARDQVGYVESAKTTAETSTTVVELVAGYEGDVTPRPNGKNTGTVSITDWVQVGRFYAGLDTAGAGSEFQRADCAPKESKGDGKISLADWVQTGRFAIGLDPVVSTGGATIPSFALAGSGFNNALFRSLYSSQKAQSLTLNGVRTVQAVNTNFTRGKIGTMQIALDAQGNENAVAFSLQFDPKAMSFVEATAGDGANGAAVIVNSSQAANGRVGLAMMLPAGQQLAAGTRNLLNLRFIPNGGDGAVSTSISFSDQLLAREIVDALATPIAQVSYVGSTVNISGKAVATVSAANYVGGEQAAESIVSAFGLQLSSFTQAAPSLPLPISLGGSQVIVKDSKNVERFAPLFYASPGQINFQIPAGTAEGVATLTIFGGAGISQTGLVMIGKVVPAIFSADSTGVGLAAGSALTVRADGSRTENNLARYDVATSKFIAQPIDMGGSGDQVYLTLYGTGIKNRNDLANVKVKIGGIDAEVQYAGAQGFFAGLDQINVRVPQGLSGRGIVNIELIVEGKIGNIIMAAIR